MDSAQFVQNIKKCCELKGVKPTVACRESGVGSSFINNIERGQTPSVSKVQALAEYLGVTVSELLGEVPVGQSQCRQEIQTEAKKKAPPVSPEILLELEQLSPQARDEVLAFIRFKKEQEKSQ